MIVRLACGALQGVDAFRVDLEADFLRKGMPAFVMVGLAEGAVREAKERVFAAMRSCGFTLPAARITVNLAPADRRKAGSAYDLPLAVALLGAAGVLPAERLEGWFLAGELSLSGAIKPVPGVLPLGMLARNEGAKGIVTAPENASEAALVKGLPAYGPATLDEAVRFLMGGCELMPAEPPVSDDDPARGILDFADVKGLVSERPFREPHHTVSDVALVGGGAYPRPGEVSLAHRGVLFLDELPEYGKNTLDVLRQPLEGGTVTVSRSAHSVTFPADCMLVAAMNPCPCGYATDPRHTCVCSPGLIRRYRARLSGPLLDRIDLHINVPAVPYEELQAGASPVTSARMRERVLAARAVQQARYAEVPYCRTNADLSGSLLEKHCRMGAPERAFLREAVQRLALSARAYTRILRISRTIADLAGSESIGVPHLAEAIGCRVLDREAF